MRTGTAIITDTLSTEFYFKKWLSYYSGMFGMESIHVLAPENICEELKDSGINTYRMAEAYNDDRRLSFLGALAEKLLSLYEVVIRVDTDEFLVPDPEKFKNLSDYIEKTNFQYVTARGFDVFARNDEPILDYANDILVSQRKYAFALFALNKTCILRSAVRWGRGFHSCDQPPMFDDLYLFHMKRADIAGQIAWNSHVASNITDDDFIKSYYMAEAEKITAFHKALSQRSTVSGNDALDRKNFNSRFLATRVLSAHNGLYEGPLDIEDVNVELPERFQGIV